jgi:hypothetical protein
MGEHRVAALHGLPNGIQQLDVDKQMAATATDGRCGERMTAPYRYWRVRRVPYNVCQKRGSSMNSRCAR